MNQNTEIMNMNAYPEKQGNTKALVSKSFTFDSAHQLVGHKGKCANVHGHTYKLVVRLYGSIIGPDNTSDHGFVVDFSDVKDVVKKLIVDPMDHAFLVTGNEPIAETLIASGSKTYQLGFRSTCENMAAYICHELRKVYGDSMFSVELWETPTGCAEVFAVDIPEEGPIFGLTGGCDCE